MVKGTSLNRKLKIGVLRYRQAPEQIRGVSRDISGSDSPGHVDYQASGVGKPIC
jgi:hypothetical protein